ncbi:molybdenum cofactor guanylyltransferase [Archaeoglobus neptunius]|uniref:molybdenum cofactor guanylyltransferase n=1 Tax=Archaeoglobus neptunius TaxID=2798580 RepID=UPI001E5D3E93|nr:molybdenum cofactor guanylyltransferase [Archaeoglobus neptunius]
MAVLVGGVGRRIGMEKTEVELCGKRLIEIAIEKYSEYDTVFVCRDEKQAKFLSERYDIKITCDFYRDVGSIAGIHAALNFFENCVVAAVDMPFVRKKLVEHIYEKGVETGCDALVPKHEYPEPLLAYYSRGSIGEIEKAIKSGIRKILFPLRNLNVIYYPAENLRKFDKDLLSFLNINTEEDLKRAEEICSEMGLEGL